MSTAPETGRPGVTVTEPMPVSLASIDSVLTKLWRHQKGAPGTTEGVLTRACMSNLIVVCRGSDQAALVNQEIDGIVSRHPSRVLLLVVDTRGAGQEAAVEATVSAHCHLIGERRQVCSEMVTIGAGGNEVRKLPSAARSLIVGDLPTSLWWNTPDPPPLAGDLFDELKAMADQILYSSLQWGDPVGGTLETADWVAHANPGDPVVMDLAWRALRPWRELISQSLAPAALPGAIDGLESVEIEHGPHGLPQAWLFAGWIASALGWEPAEREVVRKREMSWRFLTGKGEAALVVRKLDEGEPQVRRVKMGWRVGGNASSLTFAPAGSGHLGASAEGFDAETRVLTSSNLNRAALVAAELQHLEPDQVFRDALRVSRRLAENLENL